MVRVYTSGQVYNQPWAAACGGGGGATWILNDEENTFSYSYKYSWSHESSSGECSGGGFKLSFEGDFISGAEDGVETVEFTVKEGRVNEDGYGCYNDNEPDPEAPKAGTIFTSTIQTKTDVEVTEQVPCANSDYQDVLNAVKEEEGVVRAYNSYYDVFAVRKRTVEVMDVKQADSVALADSVAQADSKVGWGSGQFQRRNGKE